MADLKRRSAGILLHPTSLPGRYGVGDLGPAASAWVEALARAKQTWWQVLPLGPTGYGDSPYQSFSAFAGNPKSCQACLRALMARSAWAWSCWRRSWVLCYRRGLALPWHLGEE